MSSNPVVCSPFSDILEEPKKNISFNAFSVYFPHSFVRCILFHIFSSKNRLSMHLLLSVGIFNAMHSPNECPIHDAWHSIIYFSISFVFLFLYLAIHLYDSLTKMLFFFSSFFIPPFPSHTYFQVYSVRCTPFGRFHFRTKIFFAHESDKDRTTTTTTEIEIMIFVIYSFPRFFFFSIWLYWLFEIDLKSLPVKSMGKFWPSPAPHIWNTSLTLYEMKWISFSIAFQSSIAQQQSHYYYYFYSISFEALFSFSFFPFLRSIYTWYSVHRLLCLQFLFVGILGFFFCCCCCWIFVFDFSFGYNGIKVFDCFWNLFIFFLKNENVIILMMLVIHLNQLWNM